MLQFTGLSFLAASLTAENGCRTTFSTHPTDYQKAKNANQSISKVRTEKPERVAFECPELPI